VVCEQDFEHFDKRKEHIPKFNSFTSAISIMIFLPSGRK